MPTESDGADGAQTETRVCEGCGAEFTFTCSGPGMKPRYCTADCRERNNAKGRARAAQPGSRLPTPPPRPTAAERAERESSFERAKRRIDARRQLKEIVSGFTVDQALELLADVMVELESDAEAAR
jgi:hypothetical protein